MPSLPRLTWVLASAGALCLIAGAVLLLRAPRPADALEVDLGAVSLGAPQRREVAIHNSDDAPWRIVGSENFCAKGVCVEALNLPLELPAHSAATLPLQIGVASVGPFRREFGVYREGARQGRFTIVLRGCGVQAK